MTMFRKLLGAALFSALTLFVQADQSHAQVSGGVTRSGPVNPGDLSQFKSGSQIEKVAGTPLDTQCLVYTGIYPSGTWGPGPCVAGGAGTVTSVTLTAGTGIAFTGTCTSISVINCTIAVNPVTNITSFNTRVGAVVPALNDYNFNQLAGTATLAQLPNGTANSVLGRSPNTSGVYADIVCGAGGVVRQSGTVVNCTQITGNNISLASVAPNQIATIAANTVLANGTSGVASPTAFAMSSCSAAGNALQWLSNTGFQCGTITGTVSSVSLGQGVTGANNPIVTTGDIRIDPAYMAGFLTGCGFINNVSDTNNDVDIAIPCGGTNSTNTVWIRLTSALTKAKDANWVVGNGGCWDNAGVPHANGVTVHYFIIRRSDTGVTDVLCSGSPTAPTLPTNYDSFRNVNSLPTATAATTNLAQFLQDGNDFNLKTAVTDISSTNPTAAATTRTLVSLPTGVRVKANLTTGFLYAADATNAAFIAFLSDLASASPPTPTSAIGSVAVTSITSNNMAVRTSASVYTNTSAQIRSQLNATHANLTFYITSIGWTNTRGQ